MTDNFLDLSPEDKLNKYNDMNSTDNSSAYVNYIPNEMPTDIARPNLPKISLQALTSSSVPMNPLLTSSPTTDLKAKDAVTTTPKMWTPPTNFIPKANLAPMVPYKVRPNEATKMAYNYYVNEKKLSPHIAAGIIGNLYQESGLNPKSVENNGGNGRGIAQWDVRDRWPAMQKWAAANGKDPSALTTQLDYILVEPGQESAIRKTLASKDQNEATLVFGRKFERPKESAAQWNIRQAMANSLLNIQ